MSTSLSQPSSKRPPRILIVDDDRDNCELLPFIIRTDCCDCEVVSCDDVSRARTALSQTQYDLLILDYIMPGATGAELCREIRKSNPAVPIVFYTADAMPASQKECLDAGASAVLVKPNDLFQIGSVIKGLLDSREMAVQR
jgi:OmpR-family two-component system manganese-sensing response regulator